MNEPDLILELIAQLHKQREKGINKYGQSVYPDLEDGEFWSRMLGEELVDSYIYNTALRHHLIKMRLRVTELEDALTTARERCRLLEEALDRNVGGS